MTGDRLEDVFVSHGHNIRPSEIAGEVFDQGGVCCPSRTLQHKTDDIQRVEEGSCLFHCIHTNRYQNYKLTEVKLLIRQSWNVNIQALTVQNLG